MRDFERNILDFAKGYVIGYVATKAIKSIIGNQKVKVPVPYQYGPYGDQNNTYDTDVNLNNRP